jgi:CubicO group peptidase (beta-lactamase class C family)
LFFQLNGEEIMIKKQITIYFSLSFFLILFITGCASNSHEKKINDFMTYCADNGIFNGTLCVIENDKTIYKKAFGFANLSDREKLTTKHAFYLASVSKQFTTMAIMMLKEQGKLGYDETLSKFFPEFPDYADKVTIKHMMTHTSGIKDYFNLGAYKPDLTNKDVLELLVKQDSLNFEPGSRYRYSNGAFVLLSMIVEKVSGQPFNKFMKENIFEPLGMVNTLIYDESKPKIDKRAVGYNIFGEEDDYNILTTGAGGIYSNVEDLIMWNNALQNNILVKKESLNEAYTPFTMDRDSLTGYGYGWVISTDKFGKRVFHSGGLAGFRTFLERNLDTKKSFFILTNFGDAVNVNKIAGGIRNILNNVDYELPKIPIVLVLNNLIKNEGIEKAVNKFLAVKDEPDNKYDIDEYQLNNLGYYLIGKRKIAEAIEVFKLNVEAFPEASNTYDSLGEAYMINGDYELAIKNYKKSLELNPDNKGAEKMLEEIEEMQKSAKK